VSSDLSPATGNLSPSTKPWAVSLFLVAGAEPVPGYQLVKRLGQGGFGEVWQATGPGGFPLALKFIRLGEPAGAVELRALEFMKKVRHPNLLGQYGAWQRDFTLIIAMELADDTLLNRHTAAVAEGLPGIPVDELLQYMRDAARGIDHLNEPRPEVGQPHGIQHRDIKPANLLRVGGGVKVADFGLAKVLQQSRASNSGCMTVAYAAPEFFHGATSERSDQYSLAVTYCQLRGNRLPFRGTKEEVMIGHLTNPPDLSMLPPAEQVVVARALSKKPEDRWPSCCAVVEALTAAARPQPGPVVVPRGHSSGSGGRSGRALTQDVAPTPRMKRRAAPWGSYVPDRRVLPFLWLLLVACLAFWVCLNFGELLTSVKDFIDYIVGLAEKLHPRAAPPVKSPWWD
jgi:serine/threonine protein kinase